MELTLKNYIIISIYNSYYFCNVKFSSDKPAYIKYNYLPFLHVYNVLCDAVYEAHYNILLFV